MSIYRRLIVFFSIALILLLLLYIFVVDTVILSDNTMSNSYLNGERVIISKASYGIKEPFAGKTLFNYSSPKQNEIIAFHIPILYDISISKKPIKISRCIGLPGDTIQLKEKKVYINGEEIGEEKSFEFQYRIVSKSGLLSNAFFEKYNIKGQRLINDIGIYDFPATKNIAKLISEDNNIASIRILKGRINYDVSPIFPVSQYYSFTKDNYGPVLIPYKGWTVSINRRNIDLYKRIISQYENNDIKIENEIVIINDVEVSSYTFNCNYYFVLDDNRDYADDSRSWGFLPEDHIIGKVF